MVDLYAEPNNNSPLNPEAASLWDNPESTFTIHQVHRE